MKKVARLEWIARTFGSEFVLPYRVEHDWLGILQAVVLLTSRGQSVSLRTDLADGSNEQGLLLPFVHPIVTIGALREVWDLHGRQLTYIITENVLPEQDWCNVVVERFGPTLFLVEWDEGGCAQRDWECSVQPLNHAFVETADAGRLAILPGWGTVWTRRPRQLPARTQFEKLALRLATLPPEAEATTVYTVRKDRKIVIW